MYQRLLRLLTSRLNVSKMAEECQVKDTKVKHETEASADTSSLVRKKKVAALIAYNGKGYYGIQINKPYPTIEEEIFKALLKVGAITQDHHDNPNKMSFQRAARTDKGVSASSNVISLKMVCNIENIVQKLNVELPEQIRFMGFVRTTKGFDCKHFCTGRTYVYLLPTYALAPVEVQLTEDFRVSEEILIRMNQILGKFVGTHNFHNYTKGIKPTEDKAKRYIRSFECGKPYVKDGIEYVILTVNGQSFVIHHIRKMVGITIAILRGYCGEDVIEMSWGHDKVDIPIAPGLGLLLQDLEFDGYNKKWGKDGMHEPVEWSAYKEKILNFRDNVILPDIYKTEKEEKSMMQWLSTLSYHTFDTERNCDDLSAPKRRKLQDDVKTDQESNDGQKKEDVGEGTQETTPDAVDCRNENDNGTDGSVTNKEQGVETTKSGDQDGDKVTEEITV